MSLCRAGECFEVDAYQIFKMLRFKRFESFVDSMKLLIFLGLLSKLRLSWGTKEAVVYFILQVTQEANTLSHQAPNLLENSTLLLCSGYQIFSKSLDVQ
jgi:hypothetical protein